MNADGTQPMPLSDEHGQSPSWSPDGESIAFTASRDGEQGVWVMAADGSSPSKLTSLAGFYWDPAWSPDGEFITFAGNYDYHTEVYVMNADGSAQINLTGRSSGETPAWSPDGSRIAYSCSAGIVGVDQICLISADGSGRIQLTDGAGSNYSPAWAPE